MSWLERLFGKKFSSQEKSDRQAESENQKTSQRPPAEYNWSVGDKAETVDRPLPAEHKGLRGEYDPSGLAKRVAEAFDKDPELYNIETVHIAQKGDIIVLKGSVKSGDILDRLKEVAAQVDGAKAVNTTAVKVEAVR